MTISGHFSANYLYENLSQNWDSDGHFEVLNKSESWFVQQLWHKTQKNPTYKTHKKHKCFFSTTPQKTKMKIFVFWVMNLNQSRFRPVKHLQMSVWILILWSIVLWLPKKMAGYGRKTAIYHSLSFPPNSL